MSHLSVPSISLYPLFSMYFDNIWKSDHIHFKVWDEITYLFPNFIDK